MNFNQTKRRKSTLGQRFRNGENPPPLPLPHPTFPSKTPKTGLLARHKTVLPANDKASKDFIIRKQLFSKSPGYSFLQPKKEVCGMASYRLPVSTYSPSESNGSYQGSDMLNVTGVQSIQDDEQGPSSNSTCLFSSSFSTTSKVNKNQEVHIPKSVTTKQLLSEKPISVAKMLAKDKYFLYDKLEPPKSPGPLQYELLLEREMASLKPPVDPDDLITIKNLNLENSPASNTLTEDNFNSQLDYNQTDNACGGSDIEVQLTASSKKLSIIHEKEEKPEEPCEDLDTTFSFLMAEQTIINQTLNETERNIEIPSTQKDFKNSINGMESILEGKHDGESELFEEIVDALNEVDKTMVQLSTLKLKLQRIIEKKGKKNTENKENVPVTTAKKGNKWLNELKSTNPNLLKTPKLNRESISRLSLLNQSTWTPHSLSTVLSEQVDDLFNY